MDAIVVILTWNQYEITRECIISTYKSENIDFHIILVDNGSADETAVKLKVEFPQIEVIYLTNNKGFAAGCNYGLKKAMEYSSINSIIFLSNDIIIDRYCLSELVKSSENNTDVGVAVPKIYYHDNPDILWYAGGAFNKYWGTVKHYGYRKPDNIRYDEAREVSFANGCAFLIKRDVLLKVGYLDEDYFSYSEDLDYSIKLFKNKYKIFYCSNATIWHRVSFSHRDSSSISELVYYSIRNKIILLKKHKEIFSKYGGIIGITFLVIKYFLRSIVYRDWMSIKMTIYALSDGYNYRTGKRKVTNEST